MTIVADVTEDSIVDQIEEAAGDAQFVIVDLEETASLMVASVIGMVVVPAFRSNKLQTISLDLTTPCKYKLSYSFLISFG